MTDITNDNATTDPPVNYEICDLSGFRAKRGQLRETWDGLMVLPDFWEPKHDQLFVRSIVDKPNRGSIRPDDTLRENFLSSSITVDDL